MKKVVILVLFFTTLSFAAFGHGGGNGHGHGNGNGNNIDYPLCAVNNCFEQAVHSHNNQYYSPHFFDDGHSYHERCQINSCNYSVIHTHNGHHFFPRAYR
jgi:hypothetical protein